MANRTSPLLAVLIDADNIPARFAEAILDDVPVPVDPIDAVRNMAVIDAVLASDGAG